MSFFKTYSLITFASALLLFFLDGTEETNAVYELVTFPILINLFFVYPVYLVLKVLGMIWRKITGGDKPLSGAQRAAVARSKANELMDKLNSEQDKNKIKKIKEELKELIQEYKTVLKSMKRVKEVYEEHTERQRRMNSPEAWAHRAKMAEKMAKRQKKGDIASKVKCPHCDSVGTVRRKVEKNLEETREKGIVGAVIGRKTITDKGEITKFFCDNCGTSWTT